VDLLARSFFLEFHLDLVGGLAGDMFLAALLDAFPQHEPLVQRAIHSVFEERAIACSVVEHRDAVLRGRRFQVLARASQRAAGLSGSTQAHVTWRSIRKRLEAAPLSPAVRDHAISIFELLADAEGHVHGIDPETVGFHEVGAWDSIADIVGAAAMIDAVGARGWTTSPVPLGGGHIGCAHGTLPVPAPATVQLLLGMPIIDDGIGGERVTPTGAAILKYLCPPGPKTTGAPPRVRTLIASGLGFGTRSLPGISNHLRVLCFEPMSASLEETERLLDVLEFEVDDQTGEDLSSGLERLRQHEAVLDVTQTPVFGKKGRIMFHVRVLVRHTQAEGVIAACFRETTTIGLRHQIVRGVALPRNTEHVSVDGHRLRVKVAQRPGGMTAKTESDDVQELGDHARRADLRTQAAQSALRAAGVDLDA
jgi:uncharacterized protein (TIGR00299 family) protein